MSSLKEINYYPAAGGWAYMWTNFDPTAIDSDFARMHALGANTVRIFVQPYVFGFPTVSSTMAARFAQVVQMAADNDLKVHVTLFDWFSDATDITGSEQWVSSLLGPYRDNPEIEIAELKNELPPTDPAAITWARALLPYLQSTVPDALTTVSVAYIPPLEFLTFTQELAADPPDFWDYHYYGPDWNAATAFGYLKEVAGSRPLFIGETGMSTDVSGETQAAADAAQASYLQTVFGAAQQTGLPAPAVWTLNDFTSSAIPAGITASNPAEYGYGLYTVDGTAKPAAAVVQAAFGG